MKKIIAVVLCFTFVMTLFSVSFSEANKTESGEIKSELLYGLGASNDFLFNNSSKRAIPVAVLFFELSDKLGKGPLDVADVLTPITSSCWIGITEDRKSLIVVSPFEEGNSILTIDYSTKGVIKYKVHKNSLTDKDLTNQLSSLFAEYNSTRYYEVTGEELIDAFKQIGITITGN